MLSYCTCGFDGIGAKTIIFIKHVYEYIEYKDEVQKKKISLHNEDTDKSNEKEMVEDKIDRTNITPLIITYKFTASPFFIYQ